MKRLFEWRGIDLAQTATGFVKFATASGNLTGHKTGQSEALAGVYSRTSRFGGVAGLKR